MYLWFTESEWMQVLLDLFRPIYDIICLQFDIRPIPQSCEWIIVIMADVPRHPVHVGTNAHAPNVNTFSDWKYICYIIALTYHHTRPNGYLPYALFTRTRRMPPLFFGKDRVPDFVWVPQAKGMHQIMQIDFENYNFFCFCSPSDTPCRADSVGPQAVKFCHSLILAPHLLKNSGSAPVCGVQNLCCNRQSSIKRYDRLKEKGNLLWRPSYHHVWEVGYCTSGFIHS